jgi:uncharacterized protein DUF5134
VFPSLALVLAFTAVFAVTGLCSLVRLVLVPAGAGGGDRMAELSHLLMSIGMVGMTWGWPGGPDTAGGVAQLAVFGLLAVMFVVRVLDPAEHPSVGSAYHVLVLGAMVWMVAAMPRLMGMNADSASMPAAHRHDGHTAAGGTAGISGAGTAGPAPAWMHVVTVAFLVLLCAAALAIVVGALRHAPMLVPAAAPQQAESGTRPGPRINPRLDVACHVLMSGGMAGMLLAML